MSETELAVDNVSDSERPRVNIAVPRKGRPLEAVLELFADRTGSGELIDEVISTLQYEKRVAKGNIEPAENVYERMTAYSDLDHPARPEYTLLRDDRNGKPRRIVFDSLTVPFDTVDIRLIGREEPFRALRTHEFALGFDSADLVLEEVVTIRREPLSDLSDLDERIDPVDTDVRIVCGLRDTVYHTLLVSPEVRRNDPTPDEPLTRSFLETYEGPICISPRYERLVTAILGTRLLDGITFTYPDEESEEAAITETGVGVYLTVSGSTAKEHGLEVGTKLFPSETVLMENRQEIGDDSIERVKSVLDTSELSPSLRVR